MSKELAVGDQSSEPVTPDPRNPSASWVLRIGETHPATEASSTRVDRECAPLGDGEGRGLDLQAVQSQLQRMPFHQRAIRLGQTLCDPTHLDPLVHPVSANPAITTTARRSLSTL